MQHLPRRGLWRRAAGSSASAQARLECERGLHGRCPLAKGRGIFTSHNLDVEFFNFGGSTDQLLEAIATGKADAGLGLALRWLKPLEQGFDVRITAGVRGGCIRLLGSKAANIDRLEALRGKAIGISDQASPAKNFSSIFLPKTTSTRSRT